MNLKNHGKLSLYLLGQYSHESAVANFKYPYSDACVENSRERKDNELFRQAAGGWGKVNRPAILDSRAFQPPF